MSGQGPLGAAGDEGDPPLTAEEEAVAADLAREVLLTPEPPHTRAPSIPCQVPTNNLVGQHLRICTHTIRPLTSLRHS